MSEHLTDEQVDRIERVVAAACNYHSFDAHCEMADFDMAEAIVRTDTAASAPGGVLATIEHIIREAKAEALREVERLHAPVRMYPELRFAPWCDECSQGFTAGGDDPPSRRRVSWPCATAKAAGMTDPLARADRIEADR